MAGLKHRLVFRQLLKYQLDVSFMQEDDDEVDEVELLILLKIGEEGQFSSETRVQSRTGPIQLPEDLTRAGQFKLGQSLPDFMPFLPECDLKEGDAWAHDGTFYELTSLKNNSAEIVSRKVTENPRVETEWLYEFDILQGRVLLAQSITETVSERGYQQRRLCEYELSD